MHEIGRSESFMIRMQRKLNLFVLLLASRKGCECQRYGRIMRHWTGIVGALAKDDVYCSGLLKEECGEMCCNNWTEGFFQGMSLRPEGWDVC